MRKSPKKSLTIHSFRFLNQVQFREELLKIYPQLKPYTGCDSLDKQYDSVEVITAEVISDRLSGIVRHPKLRERTVEYIEEIINKNPRRDLLTPIEERNEIITMLQYNLLLFCERDLVFINREATANA